ncbi:hypothetical protein ACFSVJ_01330 [Prauserella oleivorans]
MPARALVGLLRSAERVLGLATRGERLLLRLPDLRQRLFLGRAQAVFHLAERAQHRFRGRRERLRRASQLHQRVHDRGRACGPSLA